MLRVDDSWWLLLSFEMDLKKCLEGNFMVHSSKLKWSLEGIVWKHILRFNETILISLNVTYKDFKTHP